MRVGLSFGIGPLRFYQPLNGKKRRKPRKGPPPHMTHDGCQMRHVSLNTIQKCAAKKNLQPVTEWRPHR